MSKKNKIKTRASSFKVFKIVGIIIIALIVLYFGISVYIANILTKPNNNPVTYDKYKIGKDVSDVSFAAVDGIRLSGWLFHGPNGKVIMFVHGAGNQNRVDEAYKAPQIASYFINQGYSVLLFDLRGNGESEKTRIGLGQYEKYDVGGAFVYLEKEGFLPHQIGIIGDSLGAIATIMAADYVKTAGGIVLDSPATEIKPIVANVMQNDNHVPKFMDPGVFFTAKVIFKRDVDSVRPIDHIKTLSNTPLLFLHGTNDTLIPPENSLELLHQVNNGKRVLFKGATHVQTFATNPQLYEKVVGDFFQSNLK